MRVSDAVRLRRMLDAARQALAFTQGRRRSDLDTDRMLSLALIRLLEIVGEASRGISNPIREANAHVA
jgi:uncharacterized protein with HEPN domain